jgi:hypothetical protein
MNEMIGNANHVQERVDVPVIADADDGYGSAVNVTRTIREYVKAGVAGVHIEDQAPPKRCGLIAGEAVDISRPNVVYSGGYTEKKKIASLAEAFNLLISNGAGFPHHNKHLHAAVPNGWYVEYHLVTWKVEETIYKGLSGPDRGTVTMPEQPGLGLEPDRDALEEYRVE